MYFSHIVHGDPSIFSSSSFIPLIYFQFTFSPWNHTKLSKLFRELLLNTRPNTACAGDTVMDTPAELPALLEPAG